MYSATTLFLITVQFFGNEDATLADFDDNSSTANAQYTQGLKALEKKSAYTRSSSEPTGRKSYTYRTTDPNIQAGDLVVVPVYENAGRIKIVYVTEVRRFDPERDSELDYLASASKCRWVVDRINVENYRQEMKREENQKRALKMIEQAAQRSSIEEKFLKVADRMDPAERAFVEQALGLAGSLPPPQSSGKLDAIEDIKERYTT